MYCDTNNVMIRSCFKMGIEIHFVVIRLTVGTRLQYFPF